jgi:release factor glutamine methyltransferase
VLDLGVGSGAILVTVLKERSNATGVGVDKSEAALAIAVKNADELGVGERAVFRHGDWAEGLDERFDVVLSNPPYIASGEIDTLQPEVARFEPRLALDGGSDGLDAYRTILAALPRLLKPGAMFAFEVGAGQAEAVKALAEAEGFSTDAPRRDLGGVPRVVTGRAA